MKFHRTIASAICVLSILGVSVGNALATTAEMPAVKTFSNMNDRHAMTYSMLPDPEEGTIIVDGKAFSVLQNGKGENWKFVAKEHTLYLDGYDGLYIDMGKQPESKIVVTGTNHVSSNMKSPAILAEGDLTIEGEGELDATVTACHSAIYVRAGQLTIQDTTLYVKGSGEIADGDDLVMADKSVKISHASVTVNDEIDSAGAAIGSRQLNIKITDGSTVSIHSKEKALATFYGNVTIDGANTSVKIDSDDNAVYAKEGFTLEQGAFFSATTSGTLTTALYCPEGEIQVRGSELKIESSRTAMAGTRIVTENAYISEPAEALTKEVSSLITVVVDGEVVSTLHVMPGVAPTSTPTPTPSPTPSPTPAPTVAGGNEPLDQQSITPRMIFGAGLIVVSLAVVAIVIVSRIRGQRE